MIWIKQQPYPLIEDMNFFYFIGEFSCKWSRITYIKGRVTAYSEAE